MDGDWKAHRCPWILGGIDTCSEQYDNDTLLRAPVILNDYKNGAKTRCPDRTSNMQKMLIVPGVCPRTRRLWERFEIFLRQLKSPGKQEKFI